MAHTPAPWRAGQPFAGFTEINGPDGRLIFGIAAGSPSEKRSDAECDANLDVMLAAPDLVALATRAARQLEANAVCLNDPVFKAKTLALAEEIRAVLKAAGVDTDGGA